MTIQEVYKTISETPELKKAALEALKAGKGDDFLKENGFDLTTKQFNDYFKKLKSEELSRTELNITAGGDDCEFGTPPGITCGTPN